MTLPTIFNPLAITIPCCLDPNMAPLMRALSDQLQPKALNVATVTERMILLHGITRHPPPTAFIRSGRAKDPRTYRQRSLSLVAKGVARMRGLNPRAPACGSAFPADACRPTGARVSPEARNREQGTSISLMRSEQLASTVCPTRLVFRRREVATNSLLGSSAAALA